MFTWLRQTLNLNLLAIAIIVAFSKLTKVKTRLLTALKFLTNIVISPLCHAQRNDWHEFSFLKVPLAFLQQFASENHFGQGRICGNYVGLLDK